VDPIPDVRSTAAKALGSLMRGMGEEGLPDCATWGLHYVDLLVVILILKEGVWGNLLACS
jgi:hypothetical protein